ncbi:nyctalopin-like [Orbicella faveolata]|uniref:nyctalopin-like n=1 Tax=Orbicella faveolata TaxID=48498 RepID=UPI0009E51320|nr:nyctalopin-like [Orbicella faveolata]
MYLITLRQIVFVMWLVVACESVCPPLCTCSPFRKTRIRVKCNTTGQIPSDIPFNTVKLDLSGCHLNSISQESFGNLNSLKVLGLLRNLLKIIPEDTFRNMTSLEMM